MSPSPFALDDQEGYSAWRARKLAQYPTTAEELVVPITDPRNLTANERAAILDRCRRTNMAIYVSGLGDDPDKEAIRALGRSFGLERLDHNLGADDDAITSLTVRDEPPHRTYIPYSNRPIAWHTDGYYNTPDHQIHGMILHCVRPAEQGGENDLLDHEIVYILLRDEHPDYLRALMHPAAMTIPANQGEGGEARPEQSGPVFAVRPDGHLHMRYTDRTRSIRWREDRLTEEAVAFLKEVLRGSGRFTFTLKLQSGWGLIANNVLHTRSGFVDGQHPRLYFRARYYDRVAL